MLQYKFYRKEPSGSARSDNITYRGKLSWYIFSSWIAKPVLLKNPSVTWIVWCSLPLFLANSDLMASYGFLIITIALSKKPEISYVYLHIYSPMNFWNQSNLHISPKRRRQWKVKRHLPECILLVSCIFMAKTLLSFLPSAGNILRRDPSPYTLPV